MLLVKGRNAELPYNRFTPLKPCRELLYAKRLDNRLTPLNPQ